MYDKISVVGALQTAIPFVEKFRDATFVLKLGGAAIRQTEVLQSILTQVRTLHILGMRLVIVHGGGEQATSLATRLGIETTMVDGRRVTDDSALEAVQLTLNGQINTSIVAAARRVKLDAVGLSGVSSSLITATKRPPVQIGANGSSQLVDFGNVGDVSTIDARILEEMLACNRVPVVSPLSADIDGNILNINADTISAQIAAALGADKLIYMSAPRGLMVSLEDASSLISLVDVKQLRGQVASGSVSDGMLPKVASAISAIDAGVPHAHFISYAMENSLLLEVLTSEGCGTMIVSEGGADLPT
ncbi:MAG: acetylglutamate kinase [Rhodothermales bacterium]|nr:acetylglutamate kinase [Rhodothermales bacterium]